MNVAYVRTGAVVAREYGLPCIIGATGATKIFCTGMLQIICNFQTLSNVKTDLTNLKPCQKYERNNVHANK